MTTSEQITEDVIAESPPRGLLASSPAALPFAPSLHIRAFLLRRAAGNVLVYSAPGTDLGTFAGAGGVSRAYLNHGHEALFGTDLPGVPLFVHEADRDSVARRRRVKATFSRRHTLDGDLEVIPTPGHTPGATTFLWDSGEHRFLFTGDTVYLRDGEWVAAVLDSSDRPSYLESLGLIRDLDFDVLVPWAATAGLPYHAVTSNGEARRRIDAIIARVRRGGDH
jgi:glyoxylase-like metal-dependent hydrolase (beta-lactamase superfamily II)